MATAIEVAQVHVDSAIAALDTAEVDPGLADGLARLCRLILERAHPAGVASS